MKWFILLLIFGNICTYIEETDHINLREEEKIEKFTFSSDTITDFYIYVRDNDIKDRYIKLHLKPVGEPCDIQTNDDDRISSKDITLEKAYIEYKNTEEKDYLLGYLSVYCLNDNEYEIYYTKSKTGWAIFKTILIWIVIIIAVIFGLIVAYYFLRGICISLGIIELIKKEKEENKEIIEKKKKEKEEEIAQREELESQRKLYFQKVQENPYRLYYICPICYIGKDDFHILDSEALYTGSEYNLYNDDSEEYKNNFIQKLNNGTLKTLFGMHKVNKNNCKHFFHEECKKKYLDYYSKYYKKKFNCEFCENYMIPNLIKIFCPLDEKEFLSILKKYQLAFGEVKAKDYKNRLFEQVYQFVINNSEISDEIKKKAKERRDLALKFKRKGFYNGLYINDFMFEIPLDEDIEDWENKLKEKIDERNRKRQEKEEKEHQKKEFEMAIRQEKGGRINLHVCDHCKRNCLFCGEEFVRSSAVYAHINCYRRSNDYKNGYFECSLCGHRDNHDARCCEYCRDAHKYDTKYCYICSLPLC